MHSIGAPDVVFTQRWITIGRSALLRVLFVVHTENLSGWANPHHQRTQGVSHAEEEV